MDPTEAEELIRQLAPPAVHSNHRLVTDLITLTNGMPKAIRALITLPQHVLADVVKAGITTAHDTACTAASSGDDSGSTTAEGGPVKKASSHVLAQGGVAASKAALPQLTDVLDENDDDDNGSGGAAAAARPAQSTPVKYSPHQRTRSVVGGLMPPLSSATAGVRRMNAQVRDCKGGAGNSAGCSIGVAHRCVLNAGVSTQNMSHGCVRVHTVPLCLAGGLATCEVKYVTCEVNHVTCEVNHVTCEVKHVACEANTDLPFPTLLF